MGLSETIAHLYNLNNNHKQKKKIKLYNINDEEKKKCKSFIGYNKLIFILYNEYKHNNTNNDKSYVHAIDNFIRR